MTTHAAVIDQFNEGTARAALSITATDRIWASSVARRSKQIVFSFGLWRSGREILADTQALHRLITSVDSEFPDDAAGSLKAIYSTLLRMEERLGSSVERVNQTANFPFRKRLQADLLKSRSTVAAIAELIENHLLALPSSRAAALAELDDAKAAATANSSWRDELAELVHD